METTTPVQHPEARCGICDACKHVNATRLIVLAQSAPAGPGITQREADLWNNTLRDNPCERSLVIVAASIASPGLLVGRISHVVGDDYMVNTIEGQIRVTADQMQPWTPERCVDGIDYKHLAAALTNLPATWYPRLLDTLIRAVNTKAVYVPFGASRTAFRIEAELHEEQLASNKSSDYAMARCWLYSQELKEAATILAMASNRVSEDKVRDVVRKIDNGK